jgi:hypothetical protein
MRHVLLAAMVVSSFAFVPAKAIAHQKKGGGCPADAATASRDIWPAGAISNGKKVTGRHPCGRRMQCTGGTSASNAGSRECRWL